MIKINKNVKKELINAAKLVRLNAHAPYSDFKVGAALLTETGKIYTGINVENSSYPVSICAERTALGTAVSSGERFFKALSIVSDAQEPVPPCGACRQALSEFCEDLLIISVTVSEYEQEYSLQKLLPHKFRGDMFLKKI